MFNLGFRHKLVVRLTAACFVLLLVADLTYSNFARNDLDRQWVSHTLLVLEKLSDLQSQVGDAETSQGGFLLAPTRELQQFAYVASHDLQEPLRTISSFTQLLAKRYSGQLDDKAREFINFAVDGCQRMQTLINDLLAFSRVGSECKPLQPVRCDAALDRALKNLRVAIQESGVDIRRNALPVVMADEVQLAELFQNLIANSIKFRATLPPCIQISSLRQGTTWTIQVGDNGIGISPEQSDRIFIIFQRLHNRSEYSGTGIGLAVCKKIAERHGGRIWVQPSPSGGSIFSFTMTAGEIAHASNPKEKTQSELRSRVAAHLIFCWSKTTKPTSASLRKCSPTAKCRTISSSPAMATRLSLACGNKANAPDSPAPTSSFSTSISRSRTAAKFSRKSKVIPI